MTSAVTTGPTAPVVPQAPARKLFAGAVHLPAARPVELRLYRPGHGPARPRGLP